MVVAAVLAPPPAAGPDAGLAWVLFVGSSVHVAATGWLWTVPAIRGYAASRPGRYRWVPAALVAGTAAVAAVLSPAAMAWVLLAYFGWQLVHFWRQNLGLAALAATAHGVASPTAAERRALQAAGGLGTLAVLARPGLLQLSVPAAPWPLFALAAAGFAAAVGRGLWLVRRRPAGQRPAPFVVLYGVALLFFVPVFLTPSPYAAVGGLTVAHGLQYLLLVGLVAGGEPGDPTRRLVAVAGLAVVALGGGVALAAASHLHGAPPPLRLVFGAYLGVAMAHFVVDGGLWRLRDRFPRAFLHGRLPWLVPVPPVRSDPIRAGLPAAAPGLPAAVADPPAVVRPPIDRQPVQ